MNKDIRKREREADIFPSGESADFYKSDVKLFYRALMLSANEFSGEYKGTLFKNNGLTLAEGVNEGSFVSDEIYAKGPFTRLVTSWNSSSAEGTVEVKVAVKKADGNYTAWYSWGAWSAVAGLSGSVSESDGDGTVEVDILTLKETSAGYFRFSVDIKRLKDTAPTVYNVTVATDREIPRLPENGKKSVKLDVPYKSQLDVPEIGGSVCSATSVSMVLEYLGEEDSDITRLARGAFDHGKNIFGNWSYNVANAGERGYNAFLDFYTVDAIKYALSQDQPIVSSIRAKKGDLARSGYPEYQTRGHLICVVGYEEKDGEGWLLINDPAHAEVTAMLEAEFDTVYVDVSYIIQKRPERFLWRIGEGSDRDITVIADYIPRGRYNRPGDSFPVEYIVIHNTGNFSPTANAEAHRRYLKNPDTKTSWAFTVDEEAIYKHLPEEERAYHAGDGRDGKGNTTGVGIEICVNHEYHGSTEPTEHFRKAVSNAAQLTAELMYKYGLGTDRIKQHNFFSGKNCPQNMREGDMWDAFVEECGNRYDAIVKRRKA